MLSDAGSTPAASTNFGNLFGNSFAFPAVPAASSISPSVNHISGVLGWRLSPEFAEFTALSAWFGFI
jgi:hypothetical protein